MKCTLIRSKTSIKKNNSKTHTHQRSLSSYVRSWGFNPHLQSQPPNFWKCCSLDDFHALVTLGNFRVDHSFNLKASAKCIHFNLSQSVWDKQVSVWILFSEGWVFLLWSGRYFSPKICNKKKWLKQIELSSSTELYMYSNIMCSSWPTIISLVWLNAQRDLLKQHCLGWKKN